MSRNNVHFFYIIINKNETVISYDLYINLVGEQSILMFYIINFPETLPVSFLKEYFLLCQWVASPKNNFNNEMELWKLMLGQSEVVLLRFCRVATKNSWRICLRQACGWSKSLQMPFCKLYLPNRMSLYASNDFLYF